MAYRDDIASLGADHHYPFEDDSLDEIGSVNGTDTSVFYSDLPIALDASNSMTTNAIADKVALATTTEINNSAQARKAISGWFMATAIQTPPRRIYGEGNATTCFQFVIAYGNTVMLEVKSSTTFDVQVIGPVAQPNRPYHYYGRFQGNSFGNIVEFYVDGLKQTLAVPSNAAPDATTLIARSVAEWGDPLGSEGIGGGSLTITAGINHRYNHWATWGDEVDAIMSDSDIREILFERGALSDITISSDTEVNMQSALNVLIGTTRPDYPVCIDIEAVSGGGDFTLNLDNILFNNLASVHIRYLGTADTLTIRNTNGSNASISSAPFGGTIILSTEVTLDFLILDIKTNSPVVGALIYIEADSGGNLTPGTEIVSTPTNGSGIVSTTFNYIIDQPIIGKVGKGTSTIYYVQGVIAGPITNTGLTQTILLIPDE